MWMRVLTGLAAGVLGASAVSVGLPADATTGGLANTTADASEDAATAALANTTTVALPNATNVAPAFTAAPLSAAAGTQDNVTGSAPTSAPTAAPADTTAEWTSSSTTTTASGDTTMAASANITMSTAAKASTAASSDATTAAAADSSTGAATQANVAAVDNASTAATADATKAAAANTSIAASPNATTTAVPSNVTIAADANTSIVGLADTSGSAAANATSANVTVAAAANDTMTAPANASTPAPATNATATQANATTAASANATTGAPLVGAVDASANMTMTAADNDSVDAALTGTADASANVTATASASATMGATLHGNADASANTTATASANATIGASLNGTANASADVTTRASANATTSSANATVGAALNVTPDTSANTTAAAANVTAAAQANTTTAAHLANATAGAPANATSATANATADGAPANASAATAEANASAANASAAVLPGTTTSTPAGEQEDKRLCQPKEDRHGVWNGSLEPGGEYTLTCNTGYAVDKNTTVTLRCSKEEVQWNADPWCENIDDCAQRKHGCGPAGLCVDHVGYSECLCERGAVMRNTSHNEEVCYFMNESGHCNGRSCGAHGICVDLAEYQQSFDTGDSSFRCSCERGFRDDGNTCKAVDCGKRVDTMGTWSGSSEYLGEYTLECEEGAFVLGGSQKAITVSCPSDGKWMSEPTFNSTPPRCLSPTQELHDQRMANLRFWMNVVMSMSCICGAALAAGLTMGLVSLEPREMEIIQRARLDDCLNDEERERLEVQKDAARHILPFIKDHHLLLVTLLLLNALANEALPIFLDQVVSPFVAVLLSVTFVLLCGEILPSAVFTGPLQLTIASKLIPCVRFLRCFLYIIAKPIALALDHGLPHKSPEEELYTRPEIRAVLSLHSRGPAGDESRTSASTKSWASHQSSHGQAEPLFDAEAPSPQAAEPDVVPPLDGLEAQLCFRILDLGEATVEESCGYLNIRRCSSAFHAVAQASLAVVAAGAAAAEGAEAVVVFRSLELVKWPIEVPLTELVGVIRLPELLVAGPSVSVRDLCFGQQAFVPANSTVTDALTTLADVSTMPCGFAVVIQRHEFVGLFDGEEVLAGLLSTPAKMESNGLPAMIPKALPRESVEAVQEALAARREMASSVPPQTAPLSPVHEQSSSHSFGRRVKVDFDGAAGLGGSDGLVQRVRTEPLRNSRSLLNSEDLPGALAASPPLYQAESSGLIQDIPLTSAEADAASTSALAISPERPSALEAANAGSPAPPMEPDISGPALEVTPEATARWEDDFCRAAVAPDTEIASAEVSEPILNILQSGDVDGEGSAATESRQHTATEGRALDELAPDHSSVPAASALEALEPVLASLTNTPEDPVPTLLGDASREASDPVSPDRRAQTRGTNDSAEAVLQPSQAPASGQQTVPQAAESEDSPSGAGLGGDMDPGEVELQALQALAEYEARREAGEVVDEEQRWAALAAHSASPGGAA